MRIRGRIYVEVDPTTAKQGDVVEYIEPTAGKTRRTHRVSDARGGTKPAVRVALHAHEGRGRWVLLRDVRRCWRWHGEPA